jgi:hypothetical protein
LKLPVTGTASKFRRGLFAAALEPEPLTPPVVETHRHFTGGCDD